MATFIQQLFVVFVTVLLLLLFIHPSIQDQSISYLSNPGWQFLPFDTSYPPISTFIATKLLYCSLECNKRTDCRTFDFDSSSRQCRLWDVDTTTGSIVSSSSSSSKPQSVVGTIQLSSNNYVNIHNRSCDACAQSRYEVCDSNSNTCQCPPKTYWNGSMCLTQLLRNQTCTKVDACRSDLNLTCQPSCDLTYRCSESPAIGVGQTVAGFCNGTVGNGSNNLSGPWGVHVSSYDGNLYVTDWDLNRYQLFSQFSRTGYTFFSTNVYQPLDVFVDNSNTIYMMDGAAENISMRILQGGVVVKRIPGPGLSVSCLLTGLESGYAVAVDRFGNIYASLYICHAVTKWTPNATVGILAAGSLGSQGSTNSKLKQPRFIILDEDRNALYVADGGNNRVQKFIIGGNGTGITVAGGTTSGTSLSQLNYPAGICVTRDGQTLYVADSNNNRIMKWTIGASQGSVVAGSASGAAGSTNQLLNQPADISLDSTETYLYVADYGNHRVQRFRVK